VSGVAGVTRNGAADNTFPGIVNISIEDVEGESLLLALEPICVATGSACNSHRQEPSYVLRALGLNDALAQSAIRFSFGRLSTAADIDFAAQRYTDAVAKLRQLAPGRAA
jgi:cysteine desulfurase